jgi:hypothetical protein
VQEVVVGVFVHQRTVAVLLPVDGEARDKTILQLGQTLFPEAEWRWEYLLCTLALRRDYELICFITIDNKRVRGVWFGYIGGICNFNYHLNGPQEESM